MNTLSGVLGMGISSTTEVIQASTSETPKVNYPPFLLSYWAIGLWNKLEVNSTGASVPLGLKVKTSFGNAPSQKNEMEALITNHVKEYV